jgi:hypothetical protein
MEFELEEDAKKLFVDYYNRCQRLKFDHPKQGMRAMLGKAAEKVGRVATILHCIHAAHLGLELSRKIPVQQVAGCYQVGGIYNTASFEHQLGGLQLRRP